MSVIIWVIIGAVFLFALKIYVNKVYTRKHLQKQIGHINQNPLTEEQIRLLTFGAVDFETKVKEETISDLLAEKRSLQFRHLLTQTSPELSKIQKQIAKGLEIELAQVEAVKSAYAWDLCRAASLAKWCYWCQYINETEMWDILQKVSDTAKEQGKNWQEYTISFLLGRTIQGFDLENLIILTSQLFHSKSPSLRKIEGIDVYQRYSFQQQ